RDHLRRLMQAGVNDFHAGVTERGGDDFGTAVVAVESGLGNQYAYRTHSKGWNECNQSIQTQPESYRESVFRATSSISLDRRLRGRAVNASYACSTINPSAANSSASRVGVYSRIAWSRDPDPFGPAHTECTCNRPDSASNCRSCAMSVPSDVCHQ